MQGSGNWYSGIKILNTESKKFKLEIDWYSTINNWRNSAGFYISDSANHCYSCFFQGNNIFKIDGNTIPGSAKGQYNSSVNCRGIWCTLKMEWDIVNKSVIITVENQEGTILLSYTHPFTNFTLDSSDELDIGLIHITELGTTNSVCYIRNIKIKEL